MMVDGQTLIPSMAILEWIEETWPEPAMLPEDPIQRARCRAMAQLIVSDIHPIQNSFVLAYLRDEVNAVGATVKAWVGEWMARGLSALETLALESVTNDYLIGSRPTFADVCLVPQLYNARRFDVDLSAYQRLLTVEKSCLKHPAFAHAVPEVQPDAPD